MNDWKFQKEPWYPWGSRKEIKLIESVRFKRLHENAKIPAYATKGSAGADLHSPGSFKIYPGERRLIRLGFCIAIPSGYEAQIRSRSGLTINSGIVVLNAPGTIDSDYRGEVGVIMFNASNQPHTIEVGDRIAQMIISPVTQWTFAEVTELDDTDRSGGFGSTVL